MASSILSPGTIVNDTGIGSIAWNNPSNAGASDNNVAQTASGLSSLVVSNYLKATNFGFAIPGGSTIDGIKVTVEKSRLASGGGQLRDNVFSLVKGGSVVGSNYADTGTGWTVGDATYDYGGVSDLWGTTWSVADINASNFGFVMAVTGNNDTASRTATVDHIQITVYYTEGAGGTRRVFII